MRITDVARNLGITLLAANEMPNHIHILIGLPSKMTYSDAISKINANSSRFMKQALPNPNGPWAKK